MSIPSTPAFTEAALALWSAIPTDTQKLLLSNVWCSKCRHEVTMTNYTGVINDRNLLLVGTCAECHADVARVVEGSA